MKYPKPLRLGDTIAIVAPATEVKAQYVTEAAEFLRCEGYEVIIAPHCLGAVSGTYAATREQRLEDFIDALENPEVRCILCARGGYGCVHLIGDIPANLLEKDPKWIVGFSDVSALHALMQTNGIASLHAGMAKHLAESPFGDPSVTAFLDILKGEKTLTYNFDCQADGLETLTPGQVSGTLRGGNFAVLDALAATSFDILCADSDEDVILFLEDVGENIYKVDRMLWRLHLAGVLDRVKGLIFCEFNSYKPDKNHETMEDMIALRMKQWHVDCPAVMRFPVGHEDGRNFPLVEGCHATLSATFENVTLTQELI